MRFQNTKRLLRIPIGKRTYFDIPLVDYTLSVLSESGVRIRSFTLSTRTVAICISKDPKYVECVGTVGVDRNRRSLTYGNEKRVVHHDLSISVLIAERTSSIVASFKRNDVRIRQKIASKYGKRMRNRTTELLHGATKKVVGQAFKDREAIVLEDIRGIRILHQKGNWQGRKYRARMNGWSFGEAQRQIEYKAKWIGLPVVHLSRCETMGTSTTCPRCGERLQLDKRRYRGLWCCKCENLADRDDVAVINLSRRGRLRFDRSEGGTTEALKGNPTPKAIPGVDAPKLTYPLIS